MAVWSIAVLLFGMAAALAPVRADTFLYPTTGSPKFKIELPANWKVEQLPEGRYKFTSPSGAVASILYTVTDSKDNAINILVAEAEVILKHDVKEPDLLGGAFLPLKLNGLKATQLTGKGLRPGDKKPIYLYFVIFSPDEKLWGLLHSIYVQGAPQQEQEELARMIHSIKPA